MSVKQDANRGNYQDAAFAQKDEKSRSKHKGNKNNRKNGNGAKRGQQWKGRNSNKSRMNDKGSLGVTVFETGSSDNDASWYIPNGQLAKDVANVSFNAANGVPWNASKFPNSTKVQTINWARVDGVCAFEIFPTLGYAHNANSPLNYAGNELFTAVQAANSRNLPFEMPDMQIITNAIADAFSFYQWCVRAYGVMNNWDILDRFTPQTLIKAMGFDYDDLKANLANFRTNINLMALQLTTLYLPKGIDFVNRRVFLYENVYTDASSNKAQYYLFKPIGFWFLVEGDAQHPLTYAEFRSLNKLKVDTSSDLFTYKDVLNAINQFMLPFANSDDVREVTSAYKKAFGDSNLYVVNPIAENFKVTPVYNAEVLSQMENAYVLPFINPENWSGKITQSATINAGSVLTEYSYTISNNTTDLCGGVTVSNFGVDGADNNIIAATHPGYIRLNSHQGPMTPEQTLVATRLSQRPRVVVSNTTDNPPNKSVDIRTDQTELVSHVKLYYNDATTIGGVQEISSYIVGSANMSVGPLSNKILTPLAMISHFDWHFMVSLMTYTASQDVYVLSPDFIDWDDFCIISDEELSRMNDVAQYGLFMPRNLPGSISK